MTSCSSSRTLPRQTLSSLHEAITTVTPALQDLADFLHAHPELGLQETRACREQVKLLRSWNFKVQTPFSRLPTAYKASTQQGRGGPVFCFLAEYDALPKLGHGCGHNLIATSALGAGYALANVIREEKIPGTVLVMGTPGEEGLGGKVKMVRAGAMKGVDAVLMAHPSWRTVPDTGSSAIQRYTVRFHGQSAHAAGNPELGRNALDGVLLLFQGVNAWRQHMPESSRVHGIITQGGESANVIPDLTSAVFYLRSPDDAVLEEMKARFQKIARGAALMSRTREELIPVHLPYRARWPNRGLNDAFIEAAETLRLKPMPLKKQSRASSDFGDVSQTVPGAHVHFRISRSEIPSHSPAFAKAAGSVFGKHQMLRAAEAMARVGYRFLSDINFRQEVLKDFDQRRNNQQGRP